jgi:very-short-patch-repair endonuclease
MDKNNHNIIAKDLRNKATDAEKILWKHLRAKQFGGLKFRRQEPIGKYVVDFVSFDGKVIIEVDGGQHASQQAADSERDEWFARQGFKVLRFWNNEVLQNLSGVLETIWNNIKSPSP